MSARPTPEQLDMLVTVAERSVRAAVVDREPWRPVPSLYPLPLREPAAAFVTLRRDGRLMGCIGTLAAVEPLVITVADRARAAALADPRFDPVSPDDLPFLDVEVSVLTPPEELSVAGYDDLLATVRPRLDGLVVEVGSRRATLLPSVWDELPRRTDFVDALWHKARLRPAFLDGAAFCATCHKVGLTEEVTGARWLRGQDEYDAWYDSAASGHGVASVFRPPRVSICRDCHMPLEDATLGDQAAHDGKIRSHRFAAANAALPHLRGDADQERVRTLHSSFAARRPARRSRSYFSCSSMHRRAHGSASRRVLLMGLPLTSHTPYVPL